MKSSQESFSCEVTIKWKPSGQIKKRDKDKDKEEGTRGGMYKGPGEVRLFMCSLLIY